MAISQKEGRAVGRLAPHWPHRSFGSGSLNLVKGVIFSAANAILFHVFIMLVSLLKLVTLSPLCSCRKGSSLLLISADVKKLFADRMFWRVDVLDIRLEKSLIGNAPFQEVGQVVLVDLG